MSDRTLRAAVLSWIAIGLSAIAVVTLGRALSPQQPSPSSIGLAMRTLLWALAAPIVLAVVKRYPFRGTLDLAIHVGVAAILSVVVMCLSPGAFLVGILIYAGIASSVWMGATMREREAADLHRSAIERDISRTRVDVVRAQLPAERVTKVFDDIERLIGVDAKQAERVVLDFARSLRKMLENAERIAPAAESQPRVRTVSPWSLSIAVTAAMLAGGIAILLSEETARRYGVLVYAPWAILRSFCWIAPAIALFVMVRRAPVVIAVVSAVAGELMFFVVLSAMKIPGIPPALSAAYFAIALTSVTLPLIVVFSVVSSLSGIWLAADNVEQESRRLTMERELAAAQLDLLKSQLHPHFLFNALNSLSVLVRKSGASSREMLARLRHFYGRVAATDQRALVTVQEEIELVRDYLAIEVVRFGPRLETEIVVDPRAASALVPALLLQPIVENAIKHGVSRDTGPGWVRVDVSSTGERVRLKVANSGRAGEWASEGTGLGLANARDRLARVYGDDCSFFASLTEAGGMEVTIDARAHHR